VRLMTGKSLFLFIVESFFSTFKMEKDDETFIEVRIPPFNLECKSDPTDTKS
jgi:hypothetical protein